MTVTQYAGVMPRHLQFATSAAEAAYHERVAQARVRQETQFALAPDCSVRCKRGVLEAGAAISPDDFDPGVDEHGAVILTPLERLLRLVRTGVVLERLT